MKFCGMSDYNEYGLGIPTNGWKQDHIEYHGLNSIYENSNNTTSTILEENIYVDVDGPWIYDLLIEFIKLYEENNKQIPYTIISDYVNKYYVDKSTIIKDEIKIKLFTYQHEIVDRQNYTVYDFHLDMYDNAYTLFKNNKHNKYGDAGEIWVRQHNYALSVPLTNYISLYESNEPYIHDQYDTLTCEYNIDYANMLKEISNNAVQFGIYNNTIWILGYTSYIMLTNRLIKTENTYLKLIVGQFNLDEKYNTLKLNITSIKFIGISNEIDYLEHFDEFIGVYFNKFDDSLEFIIHNRQEQITALENITNNTNLLFGIHKYPLDFKNFVRKQNISMPGQFPALNLNQETYVYNYQEYKNQITEYNLSPYYNIGQTLSGIINNDMLGNDTLMFGTINYKNDFVINGKFITNGVYNDLSGIIIDNIDNQYLKLSIYDIKNNQVISGTIDGELSPYVSACVLTKNNKDVNHSELMSTNIWRVNSNTDIANIGYEALNVDELKKIDKQILENLKTQLVNQLHEAYYIGVLQFKCKLFYRNVLNNPEYRNTGFASVSYGFTTTTIKLNHKNNIGLLQLHKKYPNCYINDDTLYVEVIISALGGNKSSITNSADNILDDETYKILEQSLDKDPQVAIEKFKNLLVSNTYINSTEFSFGLAELEKYIYEQLVLAKENELDSEYKSIISEQPNLDDFNKNILGSLALRDNWKFNIKQFYTDYIKTNDLQKLEKYNKSFEIINLLSNFVPALTTCLVDKLKLIFNFGTPNKKISLNTNVDLDIKVYINDLLERNKAVGWHCGYRQTKYLNWITYDNMNGGPEIVFADIETYKAYNPEQNKLECIINTCWFNATQIKTNNVSLEIVWKGYLFILPINTILQSFTCCDNTVLKLNIDLTNNNITYEQIYLLPVLTTFGSPSSSMLSLSYGFIKMFKSEYDSIFSKLSTDQLISVSNRIKNCKCIKSYN